MRNVIYDFKVLVVKSFLKSGNKMFCVNKKENGLFENRVGKTIKLLLS